MTKTWLFLLYLLNLSLAKTLYCCVHGHCDSKGLDCQWLFIWMLIILWTAQPFVTKHGMVMHYHDTRQNFMGKDWVAIFVVKVTMRTHVAKIWLSAMSSELLILLQPNLLWWYSVIIMCLAVFAKRLHCCVEGECEKRFKIVINVCLDNIFWTAETFITKFGMVISHYHRPECHAKKNGFLSLGKI